MDTQDLLSGQNRKIEFQKALMRSDIILFCLTRNALDQDGHLHTEIKSTLEQTAELHHGNILLISARIEACKVPEVLIPYPVMDLFADTGYFQLMKFIQQHISKLERHYLESTKYEIVSELEIAFGDQKVDN